MNKRALWVLTFLAVASFAAARDWSWGDWLKSLEAKIRRTEEKYQSDQLAVAAVRGAKQEGDAGLYWKGKKQPLTAEELADFKSALALAEAGNLAASRAALTTFLQKYPAGALAGDAKKTLSLLPAPDAEKRP